jgi:hypothetical protein
LRGLEVTIRPLSVALDDNRDTRLDSTFFTKEAIEADALIAGKMPSAIADVASEIKSFGAYALTNEFEYQEEGIPFLRGTNYSGDFINFSDVLKVSAEAHSLLHKSEVKPGMVLFSMSGSVGSVAVALDTWKYPINSNQDIAKIVPSDINPYYLAAFLSGKFGAAQVKRLPVGSVQQHIFLWMIERIKVPRLGNDLESRVADLARLAYSTNEGANSYSGTAEAALLSTLGLTNWTPPEPLTYLASSAEVFASGRLDAQFFSPRIQQLIDHLSGSGRTLATVATPRREKFDAVKHGDFDYIEIGDLDGAGTTGSSHVAAYDAPSRATWFVRDGDVITSTVRPIRRLSAQIADFQDGNVCSSGFVVLNPTDVQPELLLTFLRLPVICELMDQFASASMYPSISEADILAIPFPLIDVATEEAVVSAVREGRAARARARILLDAAKRAVEIAIEDSEASALAFLDEIEGA